MKSSLYILIAFVVGITTAFFLFVPQKFTNPDITKYVLYLLIFFVGTGVGANVQVWQLLKKMHFKILIVPFSTVAGTIAGVAMVWPFINNLPLGEALAVGSGFGYYSLSSVIISSLDGNFLAIIALISNLTREIFTLIFSPLFVLWFGKLSPIASGGATSMDTTLPVITRVSGKEYVVISVFNGVVLTLLVPLLVPAFLNI